MKVEKQFYQKRGALRFVVLVGTDKVVVPEEGEVERKVVLAKFIGSRSNYTKYFPRSAQGIAICNPVDEFSLKEGISCAVNRAAKGVTASFYNKITNELARALTVLPC